MPPLLYISRNRCTNGIPTAHACAWEKRAINIDTSASGKQTHPRIPAVYFQYTLIRADAREWSDTQIGYSARLTTSAGVSGSDSFAIDPAPLESRGIREGHQSDSKTSNTRCHVNLPIPERARSTLFQRMCAPLGETRKLVGLWL
jgi:hypothetical protein